MDAKTLEALRGSIRKWEKIVEGTEKDRGQLNCPLCQMFWSDHCNRCPVAEATGNQLCVDTPYDDYFDTHTKENAQRELDFLISLLPPGESKDA